MEIKTGGDLTTLMGMEIRTSLTDSSTTSSTGYFGSTGSTGLTGSTSLTGLSIAIIEQQIGMNNQLDGLVTLNDERTWTVADTKEDNVKMLTNVDERPDETVGLVVATLMTIINEHEVDAMSHICLFGVSEDLKELAHCPFLTKASILRDTRCQWYCCNYF